MDSPPHPRRRILVSGASGFIGQAVVAARRAMGDEVVPLVRRPGMPNTVYWDVNGTLNPASVSGFDAVIHLAGEPVVGRWTANKKRRIYDSRVHGTRQLATALAASAQPPRAFLSASGINFYGDSGDRILDETAPRGEGFLATVSRDWETATAPLEPLARVVHARIGVVLSPTGGTLRLMLPLFRLALAGPVAGGRAFLSWIALEDVVASFDHLIDTSDLSGPVNVVSPEPVTGRQFTAAVARAVHRPALVPVPAWAAHLVLGEAAEETVLASIRAVPRRLLEDGFVFSKPGLADALASWQLRSR